MIRALKAEIVKLSTGLVLSQLLQRSERLAYARRIALVPVNAISMTAFRALGFALCDGKGRIEKRQPAGFLAALS